MDRLNYIILDNSSSESCPKCGFIESDTFEPLPPCPLNFRDILSGNTPLTDLQEAQVFTGRPPLQARLKGLDDEIAALELRLSRLKPERAHVQHAFDNFVAVKHPIRNLPDDILRSIFLILVTEKPKRLHWTDDDADIGKIQAQMIWTITHVSNRWRQVAVGFPKLWSIIRLIDYHFPSYRKVGPGMVQRLACQLERSASHPLHISISAYDHISAESDRLIQLLLPTCSRWLTLELHLPLDSFQAFRPIQASLPLLEGLDIIANFDGSPADVGATIGHSALSDLFSIAPRLSSIARDPEIIPFCTIPWGQITTYNEVHVNISRPVIRDDLATLKRMPSLRVCSLVCYTLQTDTSPVVNLPEVEELRLIGDTACVTSLLPRLILPSLTRLSLFVSSGNLPIDTMPSILSQFPTIQHLALDEDGFSVALPFLATLPRLESLYLSLLSLPDTPNLFSPLTMPTLAPLLNTLAFGLKQPEPESDEAIQQVMALRPNLSVIDNLPISDYYARCGWLSTEDSDQDPRRYSF